MRYEYQVTNIIGNQPTQPEALRGQDSGRLSIRSLPLCMCLCACDVCTHTYALHCPTIQRDLSLPQISFPLFTQLFMWCVAWLEHYSSAGWIQFFSLVQLYKSSKTQPSPLSLCETLHLGLFIMPPGKV